MCFLWNSGHFSSHFRTFLVEFCRDRRLRAFFVNSGLFSSHFRTFIVEFCRDRRLRAFPKILKILASSLFSLPCLTIFLTLFEPNSEWHPCSPVRGPILVISSGSEDDDDNQPLAKAPRVQTKKKDALPTPGRKMPNMLEGVKIPEGVERTGDECSVRGGFLFLKGTTLAGF